MALPDLRAPKPQRPGRFTIDGIQNGSAPPAYTFPSSQHQHDGYEQQPKYRVHSRNEERKRTTSLLSARSGSARPTAANQAPMINPVDPAWLANTAARSRSRASARGPPRPLSPAGSDFSVASTAHPGQATRSISAVLAEGNPSPTTGTRYKYDSFVRRWVRWMHKTGKRKWTIPCLVLASLLVKSAVGLGPHSGMGVAPLYGDYEAQRHWLSVTWHLPPSQWYFYNLEYWGLDYPPLTAYHSYALAWFATKLGGADWVGLHGVSKVVAPELETKLFMRSTVLLTELVLWIPAVVWGWCGVILSGKGTSRPKRSERTKGVAAAIILLQPALILIDNGHFQYNSAMLAFTLLAVACFHLNRDLSGAALFVCAMCFKQMAIYYAPAIFAYLLGKCLFLRAHGGVTLFVNLAFVSTSTLLALFAPFLIPPSQLAQALHRIFPFARGLFEDKVANFWCALNVLVKLRTMADATILARLALVVTSMALLPSLFGMLYVSWTAGGPDGGRKKPSMVPPTVTLLPYTLFNSSMAFFLFSFQVHEKSILLPLLPATLLVSMTEPGSPGSDWEWGVLLNNVAIFSMWPLLKRDGLGTSYAALTLLWNHLIGNDPFALPNSFIKGFSLLVYAIIGALHLLEAVASPPSHLPDLFVVLNVALCATVFGLSYLWGLKRQIEESWALTGMANLEPSPASRAPSRVASPMLSQRALSPAPPPAPTSLRQVVAAAGDGFGGVSDAMSETTRNRRRRDKSGDTRGSIFEANEGSTTGRSYSRTDHDRPRSRAR